MNQRYRKTNGTTSGSSQQKTGGKICIRTLVEVWKTWHANPIPAFFYQIDYCLYDNELPEDTAYFCAQWRRQKITELQKDYVILDGVEGRGHYVGTYLALTTLERYWWGESASITAASSNARMT